MSHQSLCSQITCVPVRLTLNPQDCPLCLSRLLATRGLYIAHQMDDQDEVFSFIKDDIVDEKERISLVGPGHSTKSTFDYFPFLGILPHLALTPMCMSQLWYFSQFEMTLPDVQKTAGSLRLSAIFNQLKALEDDFSNLFRTLRGSNSRLKENLLPSKVEMLRLAFTDPFSDLQATTHQDTLFRKWLHLSLRFALLDRLLWVSQTRQHWEPGRISFRLPTQICHFSSEAIYATGRIKTVKGLVQLMERWPDHLSAQRKAWRLIHVTGTTLLIKDLSTPAGVVQTLLSGMSKGKSLVTYGYGMLNLGLAGLALRALRAVRCSALRIHREN